MLDVWRVMKERGFKSIPIIGGTRNPIGVVYTRDVLQGLLCEAESEDDCFGISYQVWDIDRLIPSSPAG